MTASQASAQGICTPPVARWVTRRPGALLSRGADGDERPEAREIFLGSPRLLIRFTTPLIEPHAPSLIP